MTCDDGRPCQRCIKRSIGHLCHDEVKNPGASSGNKKTIKKSVSNTSDNKTNSTILPQQLQGTEHKLDSKYMIANYRLATPSNLGGLPLQFFGQVGSGQLTFASELMGNEISVIR